MGTAWHCSLSYPWEHGLYVGGIETVKVNIMLRIYSNKWHVYAGLAILNPVARSQIAQFARSTTELFQVRSLPFFFLSSWCARVLPRAAGRVRVLCWVCGRVLLFICRSPF